MLPSFQSSLLFQSSIFTLIKKERVKMPLLNNFWTINGMARKRSTNIDHYEVILNELLLEKEALFFLTSNLEFWWAVPVKLILQILLDTKTDCAQNSKLWKKVYIYTLKFHMEVNETILKMLYSKSLTKTKLNFYLFWGAGGKFRYLGMLAQN